MYKIMTTYVKIEEVPTGTLHTIITKYHKGMKIKELLGKYFCETPKELIEEIKHYPHK